MGVRTTFVVAWWLAVFVAAGPLLAGESELTGEVRAWLRSYDEAFNAKDVARLAAFYHPDVTIFEGGSVDRGWAAYRDHHLGPELKEFEALEFRHLEPTAHPLGHDGRAAYVTAEYRLKARIEGRDIDAEGIETLVLVKEERGAWRIRHSHTSSRRRPPAPSPQPK